MSELGDLLELLHTARGRCHALRMAIRVWEDPGATRDVAGAAGHLHATGAEPARPTDREDRLWYSAPDRARLETGPFPTGERLVSITDGPVQISRLGEAAAVREETGRFRRDVAFGEHEPLLDPSSLSAVADIEVVGTAVAAGREGIVARARMRRDVDPVVVAHPPWVDELEVVVDAACGLLLLQITRGGGHVLRVAEVLGVEVDGYIPPDRFAYTPSQGEAVRDVVRRTPGG